MDTRTANSESFRQQQNITNVAVYSLSKKLEIYSELSQAYNNLAKIHLGANKMFTIYTYKPAAYLVAASLYHLTFKRPSAGLLFLHLSALLFINQYDLNEGMKKLSPSKWEEYEEASKNYDAAIDMQDVSVWGYFKTFIQDQLQPQDYSKVMKMRPY